MGGNDTHTHLLGLGWVGVLHLGFDGKRPWGLHWSQTLHLFCWWGEHRSQGQGVLLFQRSPSYKRRTGNRIVPTCCSHQQAEKLASEGDREVGLVFNVARPWLSFCLGKLPVGPSCLFPGPSLTWETPQAADTQDEKASQQRQAQQGAKDDASNGP